jgi:hypothetical protein
MNKIPMPRATAIWLIDNTSLTFDQIADFCQLHIIEIQGIADGEVAKGLKGIDPILGGLLTKEEINRCQTDTSLVLQLAKEKFDDIKSLTKKSKGTKYTPVIRRRDKPDAVAWLIKNCPEMTDANISKLIGTAKSIVETIRSKTHWNTQNIKPRDPVFLGICTQTELNRVYEIAKVKFNENINNRETEA